MSTDLIAERQCIPMHSGPNPGCFAAVYHHLFSIAYREECQSLLLLIKGQLEFSAPKGPHIH